MDLVPFADAAFAERIGLASAIARTAEQGMVQTVGLFIASKYSYQEFLVGGGTSLGATTGWVIPRPPNMSIHGLDCAATLAAGGLVISLEMVSGEDVCFTVVVKRQPNRLLAPVFVRSLNTADTSGAFAAAADAFQIAIEFWILGVLEPYNRVTERCLAIKEELMMNRWHPDRVMSLLEAGIDVEDM